MRLNTKKGHRFRADIALFLCLGSMRRRAPCCSWAAAVTRSPGKISRSAPGSSSPESAARLSRWNGARPVVAASAVVGLVGREGAVIRKTFWPFVYYAGVSGCLGYAIVWSSTKGWVNLGSVLLTLVLIGMAWFSSQELRKANHSDDD